MSINSNVTLFVCILLITNISVAAHGQEANNFRRGGFPISSTLDEAAPVPSLIVGPIDESKLVRLHGNTHPEARAEFDKGMVDPQLPMDHIILVLKRSPEQEAALEAFMARQVDPKSPDFHHWLQPSEFGEIYGPSDADISAVTNWLEDHGFSIDNVANGRTFIEFSGNAGLIKKAFHTEIHRYNVQGEEHVANNSDPSIPEALSPVVAGILSLHNFLTRPLHYDLGTFHRAANTGKWKPDNPDLLLKPMFGVTSQGAQFELVSPFDFATIYNVLPLWNAGIDGTGQTIAIAGRSDIDLSDVAAFRSAFGLPANAPTVIVNGTDPGEPSEIDRVENTLDVEWAGAVAKGATIKFVTTASTMTDGAVQSALYIIDNNVAPIMSFSYGNCELALGTAGNAAFNAMWQEGAAAGITEFVATGDAGAAACDGGQPSPYLPKNGLAVSGTASTPYNVAVGGTDFQWPNLSGVYWNSANDSTNLSSAKGYIPEVPWNGTCASTDVLQLLEFTAAGDDAEQTCNLLWTGVTVGVPLDAQLLNATGGTGGVSACTTPSSGGCSGGYSKPSWQSGTGVPADGKRDVPDVALFASAGELQSAYVFCDSELGPCNYSVASDAIGQGVGGTSVASPAMAGIMALVLQKIGGTAQGLADPVFYQLASQENLDSCNSGTVTSGNSCFFYDITTDNNQVPCATGSPNCITETTGDAVGILSGYDATTGYDLATGLGSVNVSNLVNAWVSMGAFGTAPNLLSFGSQEVNTSSTAQAVMLSNHLNVAVSITSITASANWSEANNCGSSMASETTCTVNVSFKPTSMGELTGTLAIQSSQGNMSVSLTGTGIAPIVSFSAPSVTFPSQMVGIASSSQMINLENTGTATLTGIAISIAGTNSSDFAETTSCGTTMAAGSSCAISIVFTPGGIGTRTATLKVADNASGSPQSVSITGTGTGTTTGALQFIPVTPCRVVDTRNATGAFGGPELAGGSARTFNILQSACGVPSTAVAYSLNVTVVPNGPLGFLTIWPAGQTQPFVSTLNSDGRIKANAAIVPAGTNGGVSIYVTGATQLVLDIDGYFVPAGTSSSGLEFYPVTPCRIADTRNVAGPLGGPTLSGGVARAFPVQASSCGIPATAQAYSLNVTAVPHGKLGFLTAWPTGETRPLVSTLNSPTGEVVANAAIVPAGSSGEISIYVTDNSDVVLDIDGYFAPPGTGGLSLYTVAPCRVIDSRTGAGAFNGVLTVNAEGSTCAPPPTAQGYVFNATVVPNGALGYLTLWPNGETQPLVSTLNAGDGVITSNMAIVPTTNGSINAYAANFTNLILDISSYFAP